MPRKIFSLKLSILISILLMATACTGGVDTDATATAESEAAAEDSAAAAEAVSKMETQTAIEEATAAAASAAKAAQDALNAVGTQAAEAALDDINEVLQDVGLSTNSGSLAWTQSDPVSLSLPAGPAGKHEAISGDQSYKNFVIHYHAPWESTGWAGCSLIFRAEEDLDDGEYYVFNTIRFSGAPGWDVELYNYGEYQSTATGDLKYSSKLDLDNGATNNYVLVAEGTLLTVYINGSRASSVTVFTRSEGRFAFEAWQWDGATTCTFEDAWIWELP
ncbi:MAG: hypothetical protein N2C13_01440 [Chloroflexota bacterium]